MHIGISTSCADHSLPPGTVARMVEEAGFETVTFGEHTHIPAGAGDPLPGRGRHAARGLRAPARPDRGADARRDRDDPGQARDRDPPGRPARPDPHGEGGRQRRPHLGRADAARHRLELEPRRDAQPRHRSRDALRAARGARARDARDLGQRRGDLPRALRQLRPDLVVAEADPAADAGADRRQQRGRRGARAARRDRLGAAARARHHRPHPRLPGRAPPPRASRPP